VDLEALGSLFALEPLANRVDRHARSPRSRSRGRTIPRLAGQPVTGPQEGGQAWARQPSTIGTKASG
jgi:hypothetical protein